VQPVVPVFSLGLSEKEDGMGERISDTATEVQEGLVARWRKHIQDQPASGLTQKTYCSGQGLSIQVFLDRPPRDGPIPEEVLETFLPDRWATDAKFQDGIFAHVGPEILRSLSASLEDIASTR
jgi:hypothetical protein